MDTAENSTLWSYSIQNGRIIGVKEHMCEALFFIKFKRYIKRIIFRKTNSLMLLEKKNMKNKNNCKKIYKKLRIKIKTLMIRRINASFKLYEINKKNFQYKKV